MQADTHTRGCDRRTSSGPWFSIGWLVELELVEGEPLLEDERLADSLRDMRLLGLEPTLLAPQEPA